MFRIPPDFAAQIEKTVEMAEQETHAEIVVVLAHRSGPYWSTALATSIALAYLFLLVASRTLKSAHLFWSLSFRF